MEKPTLNSPSFFGTESYFKGLPLTSKAASGYIGQIVRYGTKRNAPWFEKTDLTGTIEPSRI